MNNVEDDSNKQVLTIESELPDNFDYDTTIDFELLSKLKGMTVRDLKDLIDDPNDTSTDCNTKPFEKDTQAPPPQYHLKYSSGEVKHCVASFDLKSQFNGLKIHDFNLGLKLGTSVSITKDTTETLSIGELVNWK